MRAATALAPALASSFAMSIKAIGFALPPRRSFVAWGAALLASCTAFAWAAPEQAAQAPARPALGSGAVIQAQPFVPPVSSSSGATGSSATAKTASAAAPISPPDGSAPFTLSQATQGMAGSGTLRASIEVEQNGKSLGTLRCELFADKAPLAVANFVGLSRGLRPFRDSKTTKWVKRPLYDGNQFHRLIPDFMIQGGDPLCLADSTCGGLPGAGDPGYALPDEVSKDLRFDRGGRLGMSLRDQPGTAGSQFFITERETPWLNGSHTLFGQCEPVAVISAIARLETQDLDVPKVQVRIRRVTISRQQPASIKQPSG